jgi:Ca-activated chloride channel family protein
MAGNNLTQRRKEAKTQRIFLAFAGAFTLFASLSVFAQSGRQRPTGPPPPRPPESVNAVVLPATAAATPTPLPAPPPVAGPQEVDEDEIVRVSSTLVGIPASVIGPDGKPLTNLQAEDFELLIDGVRQDFASLERFEAPVRIALLFDNSSSQNPARQLAREAAVKFFRRVMRPQDQAAVILVTTAPLLVQPLTNDVKKLVSTITGFPRPAGATALHDSMLLAAEQLRLSNGRRVILLVTDGEDTTSEASFEQTLLAAQNADCQVYVVQTGYLENANIRRLAAERRLEEFAAQTGGAVYTPLDKKELPRAFDQIAADLAQQYIIGYYPPPAQPSDGAFHAISLRVKKHPDARIRARQGYYAKGRKLTKAP